MKQHQVGTAMGPMNVDTIHAVPADLRVEVRDRAKDDRTFAVLLSSPWLKDLHMPKDVEWTLTSKATEIVDGLMKEFTARGVKRSSRLLSLRGAGKKLWKEAAPEEFRDAYWRLVDADRPPETILVVSEERNIPWELMIPIRRNSRDYRPLGVRASVARWFESADMRAPGTPLRDAKIVVGNHTPPPNPLRKAEAERSWICQRIGGEAISPATPADIEAKIMKWQGTLLHFVCHGRHGTPQSLLLDGNEVLTTTQVEGMLELAAAWSENAPVVFLNACSVGRAAPSLAGVGGFPKAWAEAGAGAIIAPLWNVRDSIAHDVALKFYEAVQVEPLTPYARIVRDIRALAYSSDGGEDSYAAYCYFGSPTAAAGMQPQLV